MTKVKESIKKRQKSFWSITKKILCQNASLFDDDSSALAWWTDRLDKIHEYWAGNGVEVSKGCKCGKNGSCRTENALCNCDSKQHSWASDIADLTDKNALPVTKLNFGGIGASGSKITFKLGPLYCSGSESFNAWNPSSCKDLWLRGNTQTGYYTVKNIKEKIPKLAFCDFKKTPEKQGFERVLGSHGNMRDFVAFDVSIGRPFYDDFRYINFTKADMNIGGHFNLRDGFFVTPISGSYLLSFHGVPIRNRPFRVQIHVNGNSIAEISNGGNGTSSVGQSIIKELYEGDRVRLFNFGGDVFEGSEKNSFHFIGFLIYER